MRSILITVTVLTLTLNVLADFGRRGRSISLDSRDCRIALNPLTEIQIANQPASFFMETTPSYFLKRKIGTPAKTSAELRMAAYKMSREQAMAMYTYFLNRHMPEATKENLERRLTHLYPVGIKWNGHRTLGAFEFRRNLTEAFEILTHYDRLNNMQMTPEIGLVAIQKYHWQRDPTLDKNLYTMVAERTMEFVKLAFNDSGSEMPASRYEAQRLIRRFISALSQSPTPDAFYKDPEAPKILMEMLYTLAENRSLEAPQAHELAMVIVHTMRAQAAMAMKATEANDIVSLISTAELLGVKAESYFSGREHAPVFAAFEKVMWEELDVIRLSLRLHRRPHLKPLLDRMDEIIQTMP